VNDDEYQKKFERALVVILIALVLFAAIFVANHPTPNNCKGMEDACQEVNDR
jgi:hypothetical protein